MNLRKLIPLASLSIFTLVLTSCGGSSSNTPPAPTVTLSGQPSSMTTAATASITATVSTGAGVNWTVTCATSPCGSFSSNTTTSGSPTTYTAPSTVQSVTITATTSSGTAASASASISITAPPISVSLSPAPPSSIAAGATSPLTAVVTNDSQNKGVTWTVTCSNSGACGSFSPTSTASGTATTYTAPAAIPSSGTVTVTATSVTDTTKTATATITITAPGVSVALNPAPPASLIVSGTTSLTAVVSNDSQNKGVTWTATCGTPPSSTGCGTFSSTSTASGTATIYTAPATIPSPNTVTVKATSVTDTTKSASATITINPVLANGTYVVHAYGWDSTGPAFFVGAFTVSGGAITGGETDYSNAANGYANVALVSANCSLSGAGSNVQIVLATSNTAVGVSGVTTLRGSAVSSSRILVSEFDTFATTTGSIDLQTTPVAAPTGGYAFLISGWDVNDSTTPPTDNPLTIGGVLNFSGTSLQIGNSIFDYNPVAITGGNPVLGQLFTSGSITQPDSYGRVTITLTPTSASGVPAFILTGYIISPGQIQLVESQMDTLGDDLGGMAFGQKTGTTFGLSTISGTTYVFASSGEDVNSFVTFGGNLSFGSSGAISGTLAINDFTNFVATSITGGTYTVDATGRATLTGIVTSQFPNDSFSFQLYLDGNGNALQMGADKLEVTAGPAYLKTATSNDFEGNYALLGSGLLASSTSPPAWGAVGPVVLASDNLTGTSDYSTQGGAQTAAVAITGTENSSASTLSVTGLDSSATTTSRLYSYFPIDSKRVFAIETDGKQLGILALESH